MLEGRAPPLKVHATLEEAALEVQVIVACWPGKTRRTLLVVFREMVMGISPGRGTKRGGKKECKRGVCVHVCMCVCACVCMRMRAYVHVANTRHCK